MLWSKGDGFDVDNLGSLIYAQQTEAADLDADGVLDVISVDYNAKIVRVRLGLGGRNFAPATEYPIVSGLQIAVGDVDGDGFLDVVSPSTCCGFEVLLNHGDGTFGAPTAYASGGGRASARRRHERRRRGRHRDAPLGRVRD